MHSPRTLPPVIKFILAFIRKTSLGRGYARKIILRLFQKYIDYPIITDFRGIPIICYLDDTTGAKSLFGYYNLQELQFMRTHTQHPQSVLVDIGANSGFYTQNFLGYGSDRKAVAIEPNPLMCQRIQQNYVLLQRPPNPSKELYVVNCAAGETEGNVLLDLTAGMGGASVTRVKNENTIHVKMRPLLDILNQYGIQKIDVLKIDVEGYEDRVLIPFFKNAQPSLFPRHIIIEHTSQNDWENDVLQILAEYSYQTVKKTRSNLLLSLLNR